MDAKPKRKYTVSEKVVAANRRNLEKANAVPKEIRYRSTPRREAACRQNLRKAVSGRGPASLPKRRPWSCRSLLGAARRWGQEALEYFQAEEGEMEAEGAPGPAPEEDEPGAANLMLAMAECFGRWLVLARDQVERERAGLLEIWETAYRDAVSAAKLGGRLLGLFREGEAFERADLRLARIVRMSREPPPGPTHPLGEAREEAPAEGLGDPEEGPDEGKAHADEPERVAQTSGSEVCGLPAGRLQTADLNSAGPRYQTSPAFPADFEGYCRLVEQSLGAAEAGLKGAALQALVERIARLSWERHQASEREWERARKALESKLEGCYRLASANEMIDQVLEELVGVEWRQAQAQAQKLELELDSALREYAYHQYDAHPVFVSMPEGEAEDSAEPLDLMAARPPEPIASASRQPGLSRSGVLESQAGIGPLPPRSGGSSLSKYAPPRVPDFELAPLGSGLGSGD